MDMDFGLAIVLTSWRNEIIFVFCSIRNCALIELRHGSLKLVSRVFVKYFCVFIEPSKVSICIHG